MGLATALLAQILSSAPARPFTLSIDTTKTSTGSSASNQFALPLVSGGTYNFTVNWGDGSSNSITTWNDANKTHTYSATGVYTVTINGTLHGWSFNNTGDRLKPSVLSKWGAGWRPGSATWWGCSNLTITAADVPNNSGITSLYGMFKGAAALTGLGNAAWDVSSVTNASVLFYGCSNLNQDLGSWNVSEVTTFYQAFAYCTLFNNGGSDSIKNWNVSKCTNFGAMFYSIPAFNQPIGSWNVGAGQLFNEMFYAANAFDQDIGAWNMSSATNFSSMFYNNTGFNNGANANGGINRWDTGKVQYMSNMFWRTSAFNRPINGWNVGNVIAMDTMFANSIFNQPLSDWNVSKVETLAKMFLSNAAFNQDISAWNVESCYEFWSMFGNATSFKYSLGAWWPRTATMLSNMFSGSDMNTGGSPTNVITAGAQDYSNAAWTKTNCTVTVNTTVAPDGSTTADSIKPSTDDSTDHSVAQTKAVVNGTAYTIRVAVKAKELTYAQLICTDAIAADCYVNLSTGAIVSSNGSVSVTDLSGGWYVIEITGTASTTNLTVQLKAWNNSTGTSYAGNASDAIVAWQASVFSTGSTDNYSAFLRDLAGWTGSGAGAANRTGVAAGAQTVAAGGSGYVVGDVLTVSGGTLGVGTKYAEIYVSNVDGNGAVTACTRHRGSGNYDTQPSNPVATTGGSGNGCTLNLTWGTKFAGLPNSKSFHGGNAKYSLKDRLAINARKNLVLAVGSGGKGWTVTDGGVI